MHRISLGGVSPAALEQYLSDHPDIRYVNLALDRDKTGREAAEAIKQRLSGKRRIYDHVPRYGKDINDDLMEVRRIEPGLKPQRHLRPLRADSNKGRRPVHWLDRRDARQH